MNFTIYGKTSDLSEEEKELIALLQKGGIKVTIRDKK